MAKPIDQMTIEELDAEIANEEKRAKSRVNFKSPAVQGEYGQVTGPLKDIVDSSPAPITITSGRRTPDQNAAVGGVPNSYHITGEAVDVRKSEFNDQIKRHFESKGYKAIDEGDHIHFEPPSRKTKLAGPKDPFLKYSIKELDDMIKAEEAKINPQQAQEGWVGAGDAAPNEERFELQPAGEYRGRSLLQKMSNNQYATPQTARKGIDRVLEAQGKTGQDVSVAPLQATDSIKDNINNFYNRDRVKQKREETSNDFGNALYSALNFTNPFTHNFDKNQVSHEMLPQTRAVLNSLTSGDGRGFDKNLREELPVEQVAANVRREQSPISSGVGRLGGDILMYSNIMKMLGAVPGIGAAGGTLGASKAAQIGAELGGASKVGEALKMMARGTLAGATTGQFGGHELKDIPKDAAMGAGGEALGVGISKAVNYGSRQIQKVLNLLRESNESGILPEKLLYASEGVPFYGKIKKGIRETSEKTAKNAFESNQKALTNKLENIKLADEAAEKTAKEAFEARKQSLLNQLDDIKTEYGAQSKQYSEKLADLKELTTQSVQDARAAYDANKGITRNQLRDLSEAEPAELGERFASKIKQSKKNLSTEYGEVSDRLMANHGDAQANVKGLRKLIKDTLYQNGLLGSDGKIALKNLDLVQSPERKAQLQRLINISDALKENPSIKRLNALKQDFQSLATGTSPIRTPEQGLYSKLSEKAKSELDSALEQAAGPDAQAFKDVRRKYAQQKPSLDVLAKTATRLPERLVVNARVQFPKSKVQEILKTNPEFKKEIGDFVFEHITQTPASQNTIRKTMDYYGRDFLKDLIGPKRFNSLMDAEHGLTEASKQFSPKNFKNEELQRRLGELVSPEETGPFSFDSVKKSIRTKDEQAAAEALIKQKNIKKQLAQKFDFKGSSDEERLAIQKLLEETFNYKDPGMLKIQEKLKKLLGPQRPVNPNVIRNRLRLANTVVPVGNLFKEDNQ